MDNSYGISFKVDDLPSKVLENLWGSRPEGMLKKDAVSRLFAPIGKSMAETKAEREAWIESLQEKIFAGQHRLSSADFEGIEMSDKTALSTHIPVAYRDALREAAEGVGIRNMSAAARLVILGLYGGFRETLIPARFLRQPDPKALIGDDEPSAAGA